METKTLQVNEEFSIKLNGLEIKTAEMLKEKFLPLYTQAEEWKENAMKIIVTDINETELMKQAREARLILKDIRVGADKLRKELKEDSLRYGKAVQGIYNVIENLITPIEEHLLNQEKFIETEEKRIKAEIAKRRIDELNPYAEFVPFGIDFGNMVEDDYVKFLNGVKLQKKDKEQREIEAKKEQEAKEKLEAEQREAQRIENERLKKERDEREAQLQAQKEIRDKRAKELQPYLSFIINYETALNSTQSEYAEIFMSAKHQYHLAEEKNEEERIEKEKRENELRAEKEKADLLAKELYDKKEQERLTEEKRLAEIEAELSKGDASKMADVVVSLTSLKTKYEFKSKRYQKKYHGVGILLDKVIEHITK